MRLTDSEWKIVNCLWMNKSMTLMELTRALDTTTGWSNHSIKQGYDRLLGPSCCCI